MSDTIIFLGTAGARFMVANQIQASGGIWLSLSGTEILIDPGPGSIVQSTRRGFKVEDLSAIILSHRHLDHSGDVNIMVEAMTQGGFKRHGRVFLPSDALTFEPVLYSYLKEYLDGIEILQEGNSYSINNVSFTTPVRHIHPVETYGLRFAIKGRTFSYVADSRYFNGLSHNYRTELVIINVVFLEPRNIDHLSIPDAERLITELKPEVAILTHFGTKLWEAKPWEVARGISERTGIRVLAARDGMKFDLGELKEVTE